jgi:hypothetical protein
LKRKNGFRKKLIKSLSKSFAKDKIFISIGCGYAGEEYWSLEYTKKTILIDNSNSVLIGQSFYELEFFRENKTFSNVFFFKNDFVNFKLNKEEKAAIIYVAGPADWAHHENLREGVPENYRKFVVENLEKDGVFICINYGGALSYPELTSSDEFLNGVHKSLMLSNLCLEKQIYLKDDETGERILSCMFIRHKGAELMRPIENENIEWD